MENNGCVVDFVRLMTKCVSDRQGSKSLIKNTDHKLFSRTERNVSLHGKSRTTIETDTVGRSNKINSSLKNRQNILPQLIISKGKTKYQTLQTEGCSRRPSGNQIHKKFDQFYEIFPRRVSDLESKYSVTEPQYTKRNINSGIRRRNYPKILKSNFPFGEQIPVRKPFSQQMKKRNILQPKQLTRNLPQDNFRKIQEQGLFTFYPRDKNQQMINQFLQME